MRFYKNTLIHNTNVISIMESIADNQFHCVYLDIPWFTGRDDFTGHDSNEKTESSFEIKKRLAEVNDCSPQDITKEQVKEEKVKQKARKKKEEIDSYGAFISKILENAKRILTENGMLVFRAPAMPTIDFKLMLDQVFGNTYVKQVTLEAKRSFIHHKAEAMNHELLYFYSKTDQYTLHKVYESYDLIRDQFPYTDERDRYRLYPVIRSGPFARFDYTWRGITPSGHEKWMYNRDKLDALFVDDRIVIDEGKVYVKHYMKENPKEKSSVWKADWSGFFGISEKMTFTMKAQNIIDMLSMVTNENDWIFAPFDADQKLPVIAENMKRNWVTIYPFAERAENYLTYLDEKCYEEVEGIAGEHEKMVYQRLLKNVDDINDLKTRLAILHSSVTDIKKQLGINGESEEMIIEKIQGKIDEMIEKADIDAYIPVVQSWISPYWEKLEQESQLFLPTAELLFKEFKDSDQFDLTTAMIQYSKSLEKELFTKVFKGYVRKLVRNETHIKNTFPQDFVDKETKRFAEKVSLFAIRYKNNESKWHFELGAMAYILKIVLGEASPFLEKGRMLHDFKSYLEEKFAQSFFDIDFLVKLDCVVKLRNESSHPYIVTAERIKEGKEITKQKIIELLTFYQD